MTVIEAPPATHEEEWQRIVEETRFEDPFKEPPSDCPMCHTRRTRAHSCGGRVHNEMQEGVFVERCFTCEHDWHPVTND